VLKHKNAEKDALSGVKKMTAMGCHLVSLGVY
jgi:hypothetical protein